MLPDWVIRILESLGLAGAVIFVLMMVVGGLVAYIKTLHAKADKVYGYRLQERDTLNKTLSDNSTALTKIAEQGLERNALTEEQADLIMKQAAAFELLKVTMLSQYDNLKDHNAQSHSAQAANAAAVAAMSDAIRTLSAMLLENRAIAQQHVTGVIGSMNDLKTDMVKALRDSQDSVIKELRSLLGNVTRVEHRRKKTP